MALLRFGWTFVVTLSLATVALGSSDGQSQTRVDFKSPVRSAAEDEIVDLPGLDHKPNFKHFSGYLAADAKNNRFWHYWFVESQSGSPQNDPLVLWLNGGPGCSSMLGLLTELGPFRVEPNGAISRNPYAWNRRANVLFIESPAGVGFSYAADNDTTADDDTTAAQNHQALRSFLAKFPQYKHSPLYLTGESYGGVYLPTLGVLVDKDKELNLAGIAIGNGYLDANKLAESLVYFAYYHGLIGRSTWEQLSRTCCEGKPPARGDCKITDPSRSDQCAEVVREITQLILDSGVNPYNLYDKCYGADQEIPLADSATTPIGLGDRSGGARSLASPAPTSQSLAQSGRELFDKALIMSALNLTSSPTTSNSQRQRYSFQVSNSLEQQQQTAAFGRLSFRSNEMLMSDIGARSFDVSGVQSDPPCTDDSVVINYLNRPEVRKALHIPEDLRAAFTTCADNIQYTMIYPASPDGLAPQIRSLISSRRNLKLMIYNGDVDLMCNFFGDEWFVDDLNRKVVSDYRPWTTNGQVSGFVKHFDRISFVTVKGSGHMVPTDKPAEALNMIETFLFGHKKL